MRPAPGTGLSPRPVPTFTRFHKMSQSDMLSVLSLGEVPKPPSFRHHELDPPLVRGAGPGLGADAATRQPSPATGPSSRLLQTGSWIRSVEEFASLKQNAVILPVPGEGTSRGHLDGGGGTDSLHLISIRFVSQRESRSAQKAHFALPK